MVNIISSVSSFVLFLLSISLTHTFVPLNYYSSSTYKVLFQSFQWCLRGRTPLAITTFPLGKYYPHLINEETGSEVVIYVTYARLLLALKSVLFPLLRGLPDSFNYVFLLSSICVRQNYSR